MATARVRTADETRAKIVASATTMFLGRGFDAVPMSQVAEAAGVTTPALYWHFKSKTDLFLEVLETSYRTFFAEVVQETVGEDARQRLFSYIRSLLAVHLRDADLMFGLGQLQSWLPEEKKRKFKRVQRGYGTYLKEILRRGVDEGHFDIDDVSLTALSIHTMCEYAIVWYRPGGRVSASGVAEFHARMALRMAGAAQSTTATASTS